MSSPFRSLYRSSLLALAAALDGGQLRPPYTKISVARHVSSTAAKVAADELASLHAQGFGPEHISYTLKVLAEERDAVHKEGDRVELVWSGPEEKGTESRDTGTIVRRMFDEACKSVLISSYNIEVNRDRAKALFGAIAAKRDDDPQFQIRMFLHVLNRNDFKGTDEQAIDEFSTFIHRVWPGSRLPEVFYDPRTVNQTRGPRTSLHAKCIVVDDQDLFITSANFTEAAQVRNIEAGVRVKDAHMAKALRTQFEGLVTAGKLRRLEV